MPLKPVKGPVRTSQLATFKPGNIYEEIESGLLFICDSDGGLVCLEGGSRFEDEDAREYELVDDGTLLEVQND